MNINWAALGSVAVISIIATVAFVALLAGGIRLVAANLATTDGTRGTTRSIRPTRLLGFVLLGLAAALVVFGIYLILPFAR